MKGRHLIGEPEHSSTPLKTKYGNFQLHVFSWSENEQDNVLVLERQAGNSVPVIRIQSACYTGEIFESTDCDCHWQLETGLQKVHDSGGLFIYMLKDGRGAGLLTKIRGMHLTATENIDTADAYAKLGSKLDPREYSMPIWILRYFGIKELSLLTNNPRKIDSLTAAGFTVHRVTHESEPTEANRHYLNAKKTKLSHMLSKL